MHKRLKPGSLFLPAIIREPGYEANHEHKKIKQREKEDKMWLTESTHIGKSMRVDTNMINQYFRIMYGLIIHPGHSCKT